MTDLVIHPLDRPLTGSVPVPSDKSIGHRALLFSAIAEGVSRITSFSRGEDNLSTAGALRAMGVTIEEPSPTELRVHGVGLFGLRAPAAPLDCGNSGTTMRLLAGILAAQPFQSTMIGDESLSRRPMLRVVGPLRQRGATITGKPHAKKEGDLTAPLVIGPLPDDAHLTGLEFVSKVASAQVKSAILLSGLYARGVTNFREPTVSRDHTERMMGALGVPLKTMGPLVELDPAGWDGKMPALDVDVPGDISAAAFLMVAAQITKGSRVTVRNVGSNPTRIGAFEVARDMGAGLSIDAKGERAGEPICDFTAWNTGIRAGRIGGEIVPRAIDEIPILCALAARADGETRITDAEELRVKESDRVATMCTVLRAFGIGCEELPDGMVVRGTQEKLRAAEIESKGDHRIAMTACVLALLADGPSTVRDCDCIATSFPKFVGTLRALGARIDAEHDPS